MDTFTESVLATFDSNQEIIWNLTSPDAVEAKFALDRIEVKVHFARSNAAWTVSFETSKESTRLAFRIFSRVFQAVEEFLKVRQPEKLVFTTKSEPLGRLYEGYLERRDTELARMGYEVAPPMKASPLAEFVIAKRTPSEWKKELSVLADSAISLLNLRGSLWAAGTTRRPG
jgi:hypothetical protein